jgi:hypothetical protein
MVQPTLSLTYPDYQANRVRLLATTCNPKALLVFKQTVLEEARLALLACEDNILRIEYQEELQKLEKLLNALIPEAVEGQGG